MNYNDNRILPVIKPQLNEAWPPNMGQVTGQSLCPDKRLPHVERALSELDQIIKETFELASLVASRIETIRVAAPQPCQTPSGKCATERPPSCIPPLAARVESMTESVGSIRRLLQQTLNEIEL